MRYEEHEIFTSPNDRNAAIWRYVDFTKLFSLLDSASLFFARADTLGDEFEGSYSRANIKLRPEVYREMPAEGVAALVSTRSALPRYTYVNCWNGSQVESAALWGLYVPASGGVAIRSTFQRLVDSFVPQKGDDEPGSGHTIFVGMVRYVDYERDWMPEDNMMRSFLHKRRNFEYERELRAVVQDVPSVEDPTAEVERRIDLTRPSPPGLEVPVDLDLLVDQIHVSPIAKGWFSDLVTSVCAHYRLEKPVVQSSLAGQPVY
jgi:hypothetical protein